MARKGDFGSAKGNELPFVTFSAGVTSSLWRELRRSRRRSSPRFPNEREKH